jgi:two-component sensor histidine kinase
MAAMAKTLRGREQRLVEALVEERALLREVHHRVKNNLQMVASLLNIQARNAPDENEAWGLARAHDRVQLLALVHQRIYASGGLSELRMDDVAAEIARQLLQSRGAPARDVRLVLNLAPAHVTADRAVALAFLIGEAISAALDALADAGPAELRLYLSQDRDGESRFAIDSDLAAAKAGAVGAGGRLIEAFARQLGAALGRNLERPYILWVRVPPDPADA